MERAELCRRQAALTTNRDTAEVLLRLAETYAQEAQAQKVATGSRH